MNRCKSSVVTLAISAVFLAPHFLFGYSVIKIADTSTPIPDGTGTFTGFGVPSDTAFVGQGRDGFSGIYIYQDDGSMNPAIDALADTSMAAPGFGSGVDFASFPSVSDGYFIQSFIATTTSGAQAVYTDSGSSILIAKTGDSPASGIVFSNFTSVSSTYENNHVTPTGEFLSNAGIYYFSVAGSASLIQEATTTPPSSFSSLGQPNFKAGYPNGTILGVQQPMASMLAIANGVQGIYYSPPNHGEEPPPFTKLVDTATPSIVQFTSFGNPAANDSNLVFTAHYNQDGSDQQGIFAWGSYLYENGDPSSTLTLQELVASGAVAPNSGGAHFKDFLAVTPNGTFLADLDNGSDGIYHFGGELGLSLDSTIGDVIDSTDTLDGKTIANFELSNEGDELNYGGTSFLVNFTDGSQGLYYFLVPEPAIAWALGISVILLNRRRSA